MRTLLTTWVTTVYGTIGIGVIHDPQKNEKLIRAIPVKGIDQKIDEQEIADLGAVIPIQDLKKMIELVEKGN
jgi:hypothetical protein